MKRYIVTRKARKNPSIRGATLYLTNSGMWSLGRENARVFDNKTDASKARGPARLGARVEPA